MNNLNDQIFINFTIFKRVMKKKSIDSKILELLHRSRFGLNVKHISEELEHSRTTILKYLRKLKEKALVYEREFGQSKLWIHKDIIHGKPKNDNPLGSLLFSIYSSMLKHMEEDLESEYIKDLGKKIAGDFDFSTLFNLHSQEEKNNIRALDSIANILMTTIDSICQLYDNYDWRPPVFLKDKNIIIIRMHDSDLIDLAHYHFYLLSGLIEYEMSKYVDCSVNVTQIDEKEKIVDFQFEIKL